MCYDKCARCIGHSLVWLAILCIVANILLYFPNGETRYASEDHLSRFVWFFSGIVGGGLLIFLPAFVFIGLEQGDCCGCCGHENCGKRCVMLSSVLVALIGIAGSGYCVIVAALGLAEGPICLDSSNQWNYTFASTEGQYLLDRSTWSQCVEPKHVVEWNASLFSILLALGGIEFILCLIQVINGVLGGICGYCCTHHQQYDTLLSMIFSALGIAFSGYCLVISTLGLVQGPYCRTLNGWEYAFEGTAGRTGFHGYCGIAAVGAWDLSDSGKSVFFCGHIGHVVYYRRESAQLRKNYSVLGWCNPGLHEQELHRDRTRQGKQQSAVCDLETWLGVEVCRMSQELI
ncbi:Transmembrane 4 L6 family member 1 [Pteropus alecto]|uniref:Transmembrane 4 L6 family member 1 n=1 Tax=Pteropus alecto TaxID=9402 RepID=L5JMH5_PTEAL|nr:Transmembrane 4 L6 family member 1 [Pteropus alecto]